MIGFQVSLNFDPVKRNTEKEMSHLYFNEMILGKFPTGTFPLIKFPPIKLPSRKIPTEKIPTCNIPAHLINCLSSLNTSPINKGGGRMYM